MIILNKHVLIMIKRFITFVILLSMTNVKLEPICCPYRTYQLSAAIMAFAHAVAAVWHSALVSKWTCGKAALKSGPVSTFALSPHASAIAALITDGSFSGNAWILHGINLQPKSVLIAFAIVSRCPL